MTHRMGSDEFLMLFPMMSITLTFAVKLLVTAAALPLTLVNNARHIVLMIS